MPASVLRVLLTVLLIGWASTAGADVCIAIDESRDTFAPRDRDAALLLVTTQFESEGERVVAAGVFLLDSESRLRATGGGGGHAHGAPVGNPPAAPGPSSDPHAAHRPASAPPSAEKE